MLLNEQPADFKTQRRSKGLRFFFPARKFDKENYKQEQLTLFTLQSLLNNAENRSTNPEKKSHICKLHDITAYNVKLSMVMGMIELDMSIVPQQIVIKKGGCDDLIMGCFHFTTVYIRHPREDSNAKRHMDKQVTLVAFDIRFKS